MNNEQHFNSLEMRVSAVCFQCKLPLDRCQPMLACLPIQNKISSISWICASLHLLGCYNHSSANIGFVFSHSWCVKALYMKHVWFQQKYNVFQRKAKSNRIKYKHIQMNIHYIHARDVTKPVMKVCTVLTCASNSSNPQSLEIWGWDLRQQDCNYGRLWA